MEINKLLSFLVDDLPGCFYNIGSSNLSSDSSFNDHHDEPTPLTIRFQKPYVKRDERLRDLQHRYLHDNKENQRRLRQVRHDYSKQRHFLVDHKNDVEKQSKLSMKSMKRKKVMTNYVLL